MCSGGLIVWSGPGSSFSFPTLAESGIPSALTTTAARVGRAACVGHRVGEKRHISTLGTHNIHAGKASRPGMALICTVVVTLALLNRPWNEEGCVAAGEALELESVACTHQWQLDQSSLSIVSHHLPTFMADLPRREDSCCRCENCDNCIINKYLA